MPKSVPAPRPLTITGTKGNDLLAGGALGDTLNGLGGDDTLTGNGGGDKLLGGAGADTFRYLRFSDSVGPGGIDTIKDFHPVAGDKIDLTELGTATLQAQYEPTVSGLHAGFVYDAAINQTTLYYYQGSSTPVFQVNLTGSVSYSAASFLGIVIGPTPYGDSLTGTSGNDTIDLLGGNDIYDGLAGNDIISGNLGDDDIVGGAGDDQIDGGAGHDKLIGGTGADAITGGDGNDAVVGKAGDDTLSGGAGNDIIVGDQGNDMVDGGTGDGDYAAFYFPTFMVGTYSLVAGSGANAVKRFVVFDNGSTQEVVAQITKATDGTMTVTGINAGAFLGTDTVINVDRLLFSSVSSDPFVTPTLPGYLVVEARSLPLPAPPPEPANAILLSAGGAGRLFSVSSTGAISDTGISLANSSGDISYGAATGYVNDDDFMDALILADNGAARLWYGNANGGFTDSGATFASAFQVHGSIADFNNDGLGDIVVVNVVGATDVYINTGGGFDKTYSLTDIGSTGFYRTPFAVAAVDLNADGYLDLYVKKVDDFAPSADRILFGDGAGGFADSGIQLALHSAADYSGAAIGDINGDGAPDIVRAAANGAFSLLINDGAGNFTPTGAPSPTPGTPVHLADFDNNGTLDALVRLSAASGGLQWWSNDGAGNFTFGQSIAAEFTPAGVADFNEDGLADLYGTTASGFVTYLNDGAGVLSLADSYGGGTGRITDYLFA